MCKKRKKIEILFNPIRYRINIIKLEEQMDIFKFQTKVFNLPRDIHYLLREFGVVKQDNYLVCIGNVSEYNDVRLMLNGLILERKKIIGKKMTPPVGTPMIVYSSIMNYLYKPENHPMQMMFIDSKVVTKKYKKRK